MIRFYDVLVPVPVSHGFTYRHASEEPLGRGVFVLVPVRTRLLMGVIWEEHPAAPEARPPPASGPDTGTDMGPAAGPSSESLFQTTPRVSASSGPTGQPGAAGASGTSGAVKDIAKVYHEAPVVPASFLRFLARAARFNLTPLGLMVRQAAPGDFVLRGLKKKLYVAASFPDQSAESLGSPVLATQLAAVWQTLRDAGGVFDSRAAAARGAHVPPSLIKRMEAHHLLDWRQPGRAPPPALETRRTTGSEKPNIQLTPDQAEAAQTLCARVQAGRFAVELLEGVTGSGKTEVYAQAIETCIRGGRQVLVLFPEIALTSEFARRFEDLLQLEPVLYHSGLTPAARREAWWQACAWRAPLVLGARSSLFLPLSHLGLIVVDEEHDASFKQSDTVLYNGRDMAILRAQCENIPILLASATPSMETRLNAERKRYGWTRLRTRVGSAHVPPRLPTVHLVDMRKTVLPAGRFISEEAREAIEQTLGRSEQVLLYQNRRGYAPSVMCPSCSFVLPCPFCSVRLVYHAARRLGLCHHCGFESKLPAQCPECEEKVQAPTRPWRLMGAGVERVYEEAQTLFPRVPLEVASSGHFENKARMALFFENILSRRTQLIIGTQILAKGYHFPHLTLVVVLDGDFFDSGGDFRAAERCFQLLSQVGGRAGRAELPGRVFIQTYQPGHSLGQALKRHDFDYFMDEEQKLREMGAWPPYGHLASLELQAQDKTKLDHWAERWRQAAPAHPEIRVLGPAPPPLERLRNWERRRFLIKGPQRLQPYVETWRQRVATPADLRVKIDMDPRSFL